MDPKIAVAPFLTKAVETIKEIGDDGTRQNYLDALQLSTAVNFEDVMANASAEEIRLQYSISPKDQLIYRISLGKKEAHEFLSQLAINITENMLKKRVNKELYCKTFGDRSLATHGQKHVYTYSEVLLLTGNRRSIFLPDNIST